jgi:hypothetical protein
MLGFLMGGLAVGQFTPPVCLLPTPSSFYAQHPESIRSPNIPVALDLGILFSTINLGFSPAIFLDFPCHVNGGDKWTIIGFLSEHGD